MNILTSGEQTNLRETYSNVVLDAEYTPAVSDTVVEVLLRSGNTAQGVVDADNAITVFAVKYNHL